MITRSKAIEKIERAFPELGPELHDAIAEGLTHVQIAVFSRRAQAAIDSGAQLEFQKVCSLFLELFENGEPALINALNVSFLEHLQFNDPTAKRAWAYERMPTKMRAAYDEMFEYNRRIHG
jgi:hypothetical protein